MGKTGRSIYQQIAFDIATRIASNDFIVGQKLSGRSTLSSEYGVSPETVRRALNLLQESGVVLVRSNAGVFVQEKEKAVAYLEEMGSIHDLSELKHRLHELQTKRHTLDQEIDGVITQIVDLAGRFSKADPLRRFEIELSESSHLVGQTVGDSSFYQHTHMTIVAINKHGKVLLSPGPDAVFDAHDILIVMGRVQNMSELESWINR